MVDLRRLFGNWGEDAATLYLKQHGYSVVQRNYRTKLGEIDIIASDGESIVFIEVKSRKSRKFGAPYEAVTTRKQQQILRVAQEYLVKNGGIDQSVRFDVISVESGNEFSVEHIENAFGL